MQKINLLIIAIASIFIGALFANSNSTNNLLANQDSGEITAVSNQSFSVGEYSSRVLNKNTFNFYSSNQKPMSNPLGMVYEDETTATEYKNVNDYYILGYQLYVENEEVLTSYHKSYIETALDELMSLYATPKEYDDIQNNNVKPLTGNGTLVSNLWINENYKIALEPVEKSTTLDEAQTENELIFGTQEIKYYEVQEGDNAQLIALENNVPFQQFANYNNITEETLLYPGQKLVVNPIDAPVTVVSQVENLAVEQIPYETTYEKDSSLEEGNSQVKQQGENGSKNVYVTSLYENNELDVSTSNTLYTSIIFEPIEKIVYQGSKPKPVEKEDDSTSASGDGVSTGQLAWPIDGGGVMCGWYCYPGHKGVDLGHGYTLNIRAADGGTVVYAGYTGDYGYHIMIQHSNGLKTQYAHMSKLSVSSGQKVSKGQVIGQMGMTGQATGVHLHFEVWKNGVRVNPMNYL